MASATVVPRDSLLIIVEPRHAGLLARALDALDAELRRDGVRLPAEFISVRDLARAACAVALDLAPISATFPQDRQIGGNGRTLTTSEVADMVGVTGRRVRQLAAAGVFGHLTVSGWRFTAEEIEIWHQQRTDREASTGS
ncbi:MAG: helix-turn-helix domain-containing protein [Acidimicrobiales bacterium]